ncbi:lipopolysaccharide biosynthesis protein [Marinobacter salinexigens]|uniref:Lipopolysaccharide biosynthesis protein n=1 Tax=Marinobacter salinexigens TaxID=2919747 RepID=A0A5B0VM79_9GAMM|nr:XrtA system polysaccharide chain length determinant [Marinobacter salinexigens]KAA1175039.1 lipopolysaccharide biosynthesis protein [Marinobacter salinexigens]
MALPLSQLPVEIIREIRERKWLAYLMFLVISFTILGLGFVWPYKYQSEVVIFVDDSNIIQPLMKGSAVTTEVSDTTTAAREMLLTRKVLALAAEDKDIFSDSAAVTQNVIEQRISALRSGLFVKRRGGNYFTIGYESTSQAEAFRVAQKLAQLFIAESSERKRTESRGAYDFIDSQVKSYERQLAEVERRLQVFLSGNVDGTESEANARMATLRGQIELAQLEREQQVTKAQSLNQQLNEISPTIRREQTADQFSDRISSLEEQLDSLRLRYLDTYPDIVILREQIAELKRQRARALADGEAVTVISDDVDNPLFRELRASLAKTRTDIQTIDTRINSLTRLLAQQEARMERIQENKTEYSELTRDMEVNRQIYDDLLKRRERARVSMHLDVEGQGLNYRINEAAQYPSSPTGPKFPMFALSGLILGILAPFGAAAGLLQIDPRVRAKEQLEEDIGLPVLIEIPEVRTPFEKRRDRRLTNMVVFCSVITAVVYIVIGVARGVGYF